MTISQPQKNSKHPVTLDREAAQKSSKPGLSISLTTNVTASQQYQVQTPEIVSCLLVEVNAI